MTSIQISTLPNIVKAQKRLRTVIKTKK